MSRMSGPRRRKVYDFLCRRDGECCLIGGEPGNKETLLVDHWDNDNSNNVTSNLHLICRSMNAVKNPRGCGKKHLQSSVYVCETTDTTLLEPPRTLSAEFLKNQQAEPAFRHWLFAEVVRLGRVPVTDVIDCGAAVAHVSQITVTRYLKKTTCKVGLFQCIDDTDAKLRFIELRPEWNTFSETEEKKKNLEKHAKNWRKEMLEGIPGITKRAGKQPQNRQMKANDDVASDAARPP